MRGENTSFEMLYEESSKIRAPGEHRCIFEIVNATQCKSMQVNVRTERQYITIVLSDSCLFAESTV